jgi:hypothetical protein
MLRIVGRHVDHASQEVAYELTRPLVALYEIRLATYSDCEHERRLHLRFDDTDPGRGELPLDEGDQRLEIVGTLWHGLLCASYCDVEPRSERSVRLRRDRGRLTCASALRCMSFQVRHASCSVV